MVHHQHRLLRGLGKAPHYLGRQHPLLHIQVSRGLVQQVQVGFAAEACGYGYPLQLAPGQLRQGLVHKRLEAHGLEDLRLVEAAVKVVRG